MKVNENDDWKFIWIEFDLEKFAKLFFNVSIQNATYILML